MNKIRYLLKLLLTVPLPVNIGLIISTFYIVVVRFVINDFSEPFIGAYKVGWIGYDLFLAYVASYIFYFLVVHLKSFNDKQNINEFVADHTKRLVFEGQSVFTDLSKASGLSNLTFPPSPDEVKQICQKIDPHGQAPMITNDFQKVNWIYYLYNRKLVSDNLSRKILGRMPYLESELINIVSLIDDNSFFSMVEHLNRQAFQNKNFQFLDKSLFNYFALVYKLENYFDKNLKEYYKIRTM